MYRMLPAAGVCLPVGGGPGAGGRVRGNERGAIRTKVRVPDPKPFAASHTPRRALSLPARWRLRDPSGETHPVPDFPLLAGTGGKAASVGQNRRLLPGNWPGPADPDQKRAGTGGRDAAGTRQTLPVGGRQGEYWRGGVMADIDRHELHALVVP